MISYIIRRILWMIPVLLGVSFLTFAIGKVTPGDPAKLMLGNNATPERIEMLREELGLNEPLMTQFVNYIWNAMHGDFGRSYRGQTPVIEEILSRFPSSFELGIAAFIFSVMIGLPAGILAAKYHNKWLDNLISVLALGSISFPQFFLAIIVIIVFGLQLGWIPITGGEGLNDLIAPTFCMGVGSAAVLARLTRGSILEVSREDYIRTARAKGLRERIVQLRHLLRNAMIPIVTYLGLLFAGLISGAVFIESVFARPGLGRFAINAIGARDMPQIQGMVLLGATLFVFMNLVVDILYSIIDPRIVYS